MVLRTGLSALACLGLLLLAAPGLAAPPNGCADLYDPARGVARDVYLSVERADETAACFLIPRAALVEKYQWAYSDGMATPLVMLNQTRLFSYLDGRETITVGTEERRVTPGAVDCLAQAPFGSLNIASGFKFRPETLETVSTFSRALEFQKAELATLSPAKTLQCIRDIGDLFKVTKPIGAE
jgi:hypothetical protein